MCIGTYSEEVLLFHPSTIVKVLGMVGLLFCLLTSLQEMQNRSNPCAEGVVMEERVRYSKEVCGYGKMVLLFHPPTIVKVSGMVGLLFCLLTSLQKMHSKL